MEEVMFSYSYSDDSVRKGVDVQFEEAQIDVMTERFIDFCARVLGQSHERVSERVESAARLARA